MTLMRASASALLPLLLLMPELVDGALLGSARTGECDRDCLREAAQALVLNTKAKNALPPCLQGLAVNADSSLLRSCREKGGRRTQCGMCENYAVSVRQVANHMAVMLQADSTVSEDCTQANRGS